jgi:hypothetical protein
MVRLNRRDLIATLGASAALVAGRAQAACDVWQDTIGDVPTKSYQCRVGADQSLTTTFMRLSDVMFDSAGAAPLPGKMGDFQTLVHGHRLLQTPPLEAFTRLFEAHSFAFEPQNIELDFDLRSAGQSGSRTALGPASGARWRTLGVWNDTVFAGGLPMFPLPGELERAMTQAPAAAPRFRSFLRYATRADFADLDAKIAAYTALWDAIPDSEIFPTHFANVAMLADIDAGAVPGFVPLLFSDFRIDGCSGAPSGGATFVPPALFVDVAVCRNDSNAPVTIEDIFGAADTTARLRPYDDATPAQEARFGLAPMTLAPGQSVMLVQRLLFGSEPVRLGDAPDGTPGEMIAAGRATFGPTMLPKGVIVDGIAHPFEGRSHNAVILASFANCCSCPYLESWCPRAGEWIEHGKVLQACDGLDRAGSETRRFPEARTRFRLSEREHEETFLTGAVLTLSFADAPDAVFTLPDAVRRLSIGESCELVFDVPDDLAARATGAALRLSGHYEIFTPARLAARAAALAG